MEGRRKSLLDSTRNSNFLRRSFGTACKPSVLTREEYLIVLRRESEQWKSLCKEKKKEVIRKQPDVIIRRADVLTSLSEEDRVFRNERPNYSLIAQNAKDYIETMLFHKKLAEKWAQRFETIVDDNAQEIDAIVDKFLLEENELCLVCNNGLCTKQLHRLLERENHFSAIVCNMVSLQLEGRVKFFF